MTSSQPLFRIGKSFRFEATRQLPDGRFDGHSFTVEAVLSSSVLSPVGPGLKEAIVRYGFRGTPHRARRSSIMFSNKGG